MGVLANYSVEIAALKSTDVTIKQPLAKPPKMCYSARYSICPDSVVSPHSFFLYLFIKLLLVTKEYSRTCRHKRDVMVNRLAHSSSESSRFYVRVGARC